VTGRQQSFFLDLSKTECILFGPIRNLNKNQGFQFLMQLLPDHYLCKDVDQNVCIPFPVLFSVETFICGFQIYTKLFL
jgi:hypothetical protein